MKKKTTILILILIFTLSMSIIFAACDNNSEDASKNWVQIPPSDIDSGDLPPVNKPETNPDIDKVWTREECEGHLFCEDEYYIRFVIKDGKAHINYTLDGENTNYYKEILKTEIVIPATVKYKGFDFEVVVSDNAFESNYRLKSVTVSQGITSIGEQAFYDCRNLTDVILPDTLTTIGYQAFTYCFDLRCITIPQSVKSIDESFNMRHIILCEADVKPEGWLPGWCGDDSDVLWNCNINDKFADGTQLIKSGMFYYQLDSAGKLTLINYDSTQGVSDITIPASVNIGGKDYDVEIGKDAFYFAHSIKNVKIENGIETISSSAFWACQMESIELPESLRVIESSALANCIELKKVKIPKNVEYIHGSAFNYGYYLMVIEFEDPSGWTDDEGNPVDFSDSKANFGIFEENDYKYVQRI